MNENLEMLKTQVNGPLSKSEVSKLEYLAKTPDNESKNRYYIIQTKIHHPDRRSTFTASNIGDIKVRLVRTSWLYYPLNYTGCRCYQQNLQTFLTFMLS